MATNWTRRDFLALDGQRRGRLPAPVRSQRGRRRLVARLERPTPSRAGPSCRGILARIVPPTFPARDFPVTKFGAVGRRRRRHCSAAFRDAIAACHAAGGGRVVVPEGSIPHRRHPAQERSEPAPGVAGHDDPLQPRPAPLPAGRLHPLGRRRIDELLARSSTPSRSENIAVTGAGDARRPGERRALVAVEGRARSAGTPEPERGPRPPHRRWAPAACRCPSGSSARAASCGPTSSSRTAARTCSSRASASSTRRCGKSTRCSAPTSRCAAWTIATHGPNNDGCDPESCKDVLIEPLHLRHRRRLHRPQVGPQRGRPAPERARGEHHRPRLRDEGRPRRRGHRQRDLGRRAAHLRRALPDGQPAARSRAAASRRTRSGAAPSSTSTCAT